MNSKSFWLCLIGLVAVLVLLVTAKLVVSSLQDPGPRTNLEAPQRGM